MKYLYRLGKALMLPVACLPISGLLLGLGYWLDPAGYGQSYMLTRLMVSAGQVLLDNMSLLFAVSVAVDLADDRDKGSALVGVICWLVVQNILTPENVHLLTGWRVDASVFSNIDNQLVGILCGMIAAYCCNRFRFVRLPEPLGFFSGRVFVTLVAAGFGALTALVLLFIWPYVYMVCIYLGKSLVDTGAIGVGVYMLLNRLLVPTGLHHALNSVFWFDLAGISDLSNYWNGLGVYGQTGQYMTGFFPIMIFGLPGAALAMYHTARRSQKKKTMGLLVTAVICSIMTGVTEPLEFSFMFLAPGLFILHAFLTGLSGVICTLLPFRTGFNFSGGLMDYVLSFNSPMAQNPWILFPVGALFFVLYYAAFRVCILKFNLKTPGRDEDPD